MKFRFCWSQVFVSPQKCLPRLHLFVALFTHCYSLSQDNKVSLTKSFLLLLQPPSPGRHVLQIRVGDKGKCYQKSADWAPAPVVVPLPLSVNLSFMMLFWIGGRLSRPLCLVKVSRPGCGQPPSTPSNHFGSTDRILVLSNVVVWLGLSVWVCFETFDVVELGVLCSPNRSRLSTTPS